MDSEEGTQQPHLVLVHKLFLLRHRDVQDIEKVHLKEEVFAAVKSNDMAPLYKTLVVDSVLESDQGLLHKLKKVGNSNGSVKVTFCEHGSMGLVVLCQIATIDGIAALFGVVFALGFVCALWVGLLKY